MYTLLHSFTFTTVICLFLLSSLWISNVFACSRKPPRPPPKIPDKKPEYEGKVFILVPSKLSLDTNEKIGIVAYDIPQNEYLELYAEDFGDKTKLFSSTKVLIKNGIPTFVDVNLPSKEIMHEIDQYYGLRLSVQLEAKIGTKFRTQMRTFVGYDDGYVFLQTDKPIYNPKQTVKIRIIPLNEKLLPANTKVRVQIQNPQNVIVHETTFLEPWKESSHEFPKIYFTFPPFSMLGKWKIVALYGSHFQQSTSVTIHVEEYILPTFTVTVEVPNVVLSTDKEIKFTVAAEYVYQKHVNGSAVCTLSIIDKQGKRFDAGVDNKHLKDGKTIFLFNTEEILRNANFNSFPYDNRLSVKVSVTDAATATTENEEKRVKFSKSPYLISFNHTVRLYKPGVVFVVLADISYVNGKPAKNVPAVISATDSKKSAVKITESRKHTDENGRVIFYLTPAIDTIQNNHQNKIEIQISTNDERYKPEQQATAKHVIKKSASKSFIAISKTESMRKVKIGENFIATVFTHPSDSFENLFFMVIARKKLILLKHIPKGGTHQRQVEFIVTQEMSPILRVVIFTTNDKQLLIDSVRVFVENKCAPKSEVTVTPDFSTDEPGSPGKLIITGEPHTKVGLLAVDNAVYALKNQDRLTKQKMFQTIERHDIKSGPGDDDSIISIQKDTGIGIFGNFKIQPNIGINVIVNPIITFPGNKEREIFDPHPDEFELDHDDIDEELEEETHVRKDFRETWLFEDLYIGSNGTSVVNTKLPDSITTWILQAVSVSPQRGMCVTKPEEIKSFKNIFLQLNIPYSVVRNEKLDIQATVFSYYPQKIPVTVHFYGVEDLETGVKTGEKSERKRLRIEALSTGSVYFSAVPLKAKEYFIRVVALSPYGADVVVRKLNVVAEGITVEENFAIVLDPGNYQKRARKAITTDAVSDVMDEENHVQIVKVNIRPRKKFIAGTETCAISAIGTEFGPMVQTVVIDPMQLINKPVGCCEQTMMYMGPTLYTLKFLKTKGKISSDTETRIYNFVHEGYKRALTFRKEDGSFSIWPRNPSSIWLTSYVTKLFCQASKLIFIDMKSICKGVLWITFEQNSDGSFEDSYPVIRRYVMMGQVGRIPMTAFVLSVLQECKCSRMNTDDHSAKAQLFLEKHLSSINDSYAMALTAYALALRNSQKKNEANEKLLQMSTFSEDLNQRYWEENSNPDIEITAYALLTQLHLNDLSGSLSIVNWMNTQRLYGGSFSSSQDTVVALQALSEYLIKSKLNDISLNINVNSTLHENLVKNFQINNNNALVLQQHQLNKCDGTLLLNVSGKGVGLSFVKIRYNIPKELKEDCKFDIDVKVTEEEDLHTIPNTSLQNGFKNVSEMGRSYCSFEDEVSRRCSRKLTVKVQVCTRFRSTRNSDMSIIDAGIFSGFHPITQDLDNLLNESDNLVDRYEIEDKRIIFYLDHVPHKNSVCISFRKSRKYIIGNVQNSVLKIYDYYNKDDYCTIFYSPNNNTPIL